MKNNEKTFRRGKSRLGRPHSPPDKRLNQIPFFRVEWASGGDSMAANGTNSELVLAVAVLVSLQIAQGRTADELALLAAFFTVLGDNLALLALGKT